MTSKMDLFLLLITTILSCTAGESLHSSCRDIFNAAGTRNVKSGIFTIFPSNEKENGVQVYCDMDTDDGGWTVIQRRQEEEEQPGFYRSWTQYADGFGSLLRSHWLGLELVSMLTRRANHSLRVDLLDWEGNERHAEYSLFSVSDATDNYRLTLGAYTGNAGDAFRTHDGMQFSTRDRDNDHLSEGSCAQKHRGAWWYNACHSANLNGAYGAMEYGLGVIWSWWHGQYYSLKRVEMKIRPTN